MSLMVFLGVDAEFDPGIGSPTGEEICPNRLNLKPFELDHRPTVYEIVSWENGKPTNSHLFNEPKFPWEERDENPSVNSAFERLRSLVEQAIQLKLDPQLLSFWDHDPENGVELRRRMAPRHLTPGRRIFDGVLEGFGMNPCTLIDFDPEIQQPEAWRV